ncbi:sulfatase-like hydrolase/transferase [Echinicola shivajiensis]|uniref:sulfatase-like hydrolase/transferase n=1 Tax=Echinicola shivajiensis TaxID=1035916 RepID=UPI001BFC333C|nr:sulfatase-like hydrolase/transferase [Echinicola shivajiensis]
MLLSIPFLIACASKEIKTTAKPYNVLLITADDLDLQLSCDGDSIIATPHLDRLAKSGTRFNNAMLPKRH